jgi:hypothetical protein
MIQPCCDDGNNVPMQSPVSVESFKAPESWADICESAYRLNYSLTVRGFSIASLTGTRTVDGRVVLLAEIETLDPCPYMVRALRRREEMKHEDPVAARGREPTPAEVAAAGVPIEGASEGTDWAVDGQVRNQIK